MTADDTETVSVSIETRPGLLSECRCHAAAGRGDCPGHPDVESYMLRYNNDSGTITAYLRDNRDGEHRRGSGAVETEMADPG